jgi:hypothetical protein
MHIAITGDKPIANNSSHDLLEQLGFIEFMRLSDKHFVNVIGMIDQINMGLANMEMNYISMLLNRLVHKSKKPFRNWRKLPRR